MLVKRTVVAAIEIIISQSVNVKLTVNRSTIYLLTKVVVILALLPMGK